MGSGEDVTKLIKKRLNFEAELVKPIKRICSLIIDDMSIKKNCITVEIKIHFTV